MAEFDAVKQSEVAQPQRNEQENAGGNSMAPPPFQLKSSGGAPGDSAGKTTEFNEDTQYADPEYPFQGKVGKAANIALRSSASKDENNPHANTIGDLANGTVVTVLGKSGIWYKVKGTTMKGEVKEGYASSFYITPMAKNEKAKGEGTDEIEALAGNTDLIEYITSLLDVEVSTDQAEGVLEKLEGLSMDRLRVVIFTFIRNGKLDALKLKFIQVVGGGHAELVANITAIEAEFSDPTTGTTDATADQVEQVNEILNQGMNINEATGEVADFVDEVAGRTYRQDVMDTVDREVAAGLPRALDRNTRPRHGWDQYEGIAQEAKKRTDDLYGHYAQGSAMTHAGPDANLLDTRDQTYSNGSLLGFANYLVTGHNGWDPIYSDKNIHQVHNADISRDEEKAIIRQALIDWMTDGSNLDNLRELRKSWPGAQSGGNIFLQRWDMGNDDGNRRQFWKMFQTMIHEYLHKVTHPRYSSTASGKGRTREQIFTEGGTSYFDNQVWKTLFPGEVSSNAELRETVEGDSYPYNAGVVPANTGYEQMGQFEQIVSTVGEDNVRAAYFKGEVEKIGM